MPDKLLSSPKLSGYFLLPVLCVLCLRKISDPDIWFYMVAAREWFLGGQIPTQEFYIYPALGEAAHYSAMGFGALHMMAHELLGMLGMGLLNAMIAGSALWFLFQAARVSIGPQVSMPIGLSIVPVAIAYVFFEYRIVYRPETTLFLFLAIEIYVLEHWLRNGNDRLLIIIPVSSLLLAQLHTTAIFLFVVYACYCAHWAVTTFWASPNRLHDTKARRQIGWLAGCGLAVLLLPLANPYGLSQLTVLLRSLFASVAVSSDNVEYLPSLATEYRFHFFFLAVLAFTSWAFNPARRWVDVFLLAGFSLLAMRYVRNIGLFSLITIVPVSQTLFALWKGWRHLRHAERLPPLMGGVALLGMSGIAFASGTWGVGLHERQFPLRGVETIKQNVPGGNVLNFFHHGSYIAWSLGRDYKVAMDGHFVNPTRADGYHDAMFRADPGWYARLEADRVVAIVTPATLPFSGRMIPLVEALAESTDWHLVAVDPEALTFMRDTPARLPKEEIWRQVLRETEQVLTDNPNPVHAMVARGLAERHLGLAQGIR